MTGEGRLASLDALRGLAIASMVLVNNPGSWSAIHPPLAHATWNGCTFTDLVFPFFLFAAGLALKLSLGRRLEGDGRRAALYRTLLRRAAMIFLIGVLLNLVPGFAFQTVRIPGVLQRIALALALAAPVVVWGGRRAAVAAFLGFMGLYLVLQLSVPVTGPDGVLAAGRLEPGLDFGAWLDRKLLAGHLWSRAKVWDPEGLVGTLTSAASVLLGVLAGHHLQAPPGRWRKSVGLLVAGVALIGIGMFQGPLLLPLNKSLWTPSFVLVTGGWALAVLAAFHAALDEAPEAFRLRARQACLPLTIYGMNALAMFVFSGIVARVLQSVKLAGPAGPVTLKGWLFGRVSALPLSPANASLAFAILFDLAMFAVAWGLWKRRWFIKV